MGKATFCRGSKAPAAVASLGLAGLLSMGLGCAGAMPLLHPAHTLPPGQVSIGAGAVGNVPALGPSGDGDLTVEERAVVSEAHTGPGASPWAAGRVGIVYDNEVGITYSGRQFRVDARHAFTLVKELALSIGLGGSAIPPRAGPFSDEGTLFGGGADIPVVLGWRSDAELYSIWGGPRIGFLMASGSVPATKLDPDASPESASTFDARAFYAGAVLGMKIGFRGFHAALELDTAYFVGDGTFDSGRQGTAQTWMVTPSGAIILSL